jgi:hypothetical protein
MTETTTREDCFYDVEALPHPKEMIVAAIEREIVRTPLEAHVDLERAAQYTSAGGANPTSAWRSSKQSPKVGVMKWGSFHRSLLFYSCPQVTTLDLTSK